jgi:hypothetical protein
MCPADITVCLNGTLLTHCTRRLAVVTDILCDEELRLLGYDAVELL